MACMNKFFNQLSKSIYRRLNFSAGKLLCLLLIGISLKTCILSVISKNVSNVFPCSTDAFQFQTELPNRQRTYIRKYHKISEYVTRADLSGVLIIRKLLHNFKMFIRLKQQHFNLRYFKHQRYLFIRWKLQKNKLLAICIVINVYRFRKGCRRILRNTYTRN